jgi:hypothetical protein
MVLGAVKAAPSIVLDGDPPVVRVTGSLAVATAGASFDWRTALRVSVDQVDAPALAGAYRVEAGALVFVPKYRLQPGLAYKAAFHLREERLSVVLTPAAPTVSGPATFVERIYPTTGDWPENQLKFYVHFSAPMSRGEAFQRLHLIDLARNQEIKLPFLEIDEELWDREQRRLTVLFDPGRVKRGLVPNQEAGPPLENGGRYRIVVDREWRDGTNQPLREAFTKDIVVGPSIRAGIEVSQWKVKAPAAGTRDALVVEFPRPLDAALLLRCLTVDGISGQASVRDSERGWAFVPDQPWVAGREQTLQVLRILEDLAGNKVGRAFDVELDKFEKVEKSILTETVSLRFKPL